MDMDFVLATQLISTAAGLPASAKWANQPNLMVGMGEVISSYKESMELLSQNICSKFKGPYYSNNGH